MLASSAVPGSGIARDAVADAPAALFVSLLGAPRFRYGGRDLRLALPRNALRVLAYLVLYPAAHPRERVAATLWPDDDEAAGRANLRRHVHLVQRALPRAGEPWLVCDAATIGWNPRAPIVLDVAAFERACEDGDDDRAVATYGGDLLADWDDEWIAAVRERARAAFVRALERLVQRYREAGDTERVVAALDRLHAADPWREDTLRALVALRCERGDRAGALAAYVRFAERLRTELGVDPMPETEAVYEQLRIGRGALAADAAPQRAPLSAEAGVLPFVGRAAERAALEAAWRRAASGTGGTVAVVADAGVGKSRLLEELVRDVTAAGGRALIGRTASIEAAPLEAFANALRGALPLIPAARVGEAWLGVLGAIMPQLRVEMPGLPEPPPLSAPQERTRLYEAVATFFIALARVRPLLVVLEDLHWAGESTVALFEYVARRARTARLLVVATWREQECSHNYALLDLRRRLEAEQLASVVPLGALDVRDVAELVRLLVDDTPARCDEIARALHRRSEGNALYLHESVRASATAGVFDAAHRRWHGTTGEMPLAAGIADVLRERLAQLPEDARAVVEVAAVAGQTFSAELVREVSGLGERRVVDALDRLIDERIVRDGGARGDYAFTHHLVRSAVVDAVPEALLRRRHRRIGHVLERLHPHSAGELAPALAGHYDHGDDPVAASFHYARAAVNAAAIFANQEALAYAERALALGDDAELRVQMLELSEVLHGRRGERKEQRSAAVRLAAIAVARHDRDRLVDALRRRVEIERACGDKDAEREASAALRAAQDAASAGRPKTVRLPTERSDAARTLVR